MKTTRIQVNNSVQQANRLEDSLNTSQGPLKNNDSGLEREYQLQEMLVAEKKKTAYAIQSLRKYKEKMGYEIAQAKIKIEKEKKKHEEIASQWKTTADSILWQAGKDNIKTKEESESSNHSIVEKLRRQIGSQEIASQVLQWQLNTAQEKKNKDEKKLHNYINVLQQKVVALRNQMSTISFYVHHLTQEVFHELEFSVNAIVDIMPKPKVGAQEAAELAQAAIVLRSSILKLLRELLSVNENDTMSVMSRMRATKEVQDLIGLLEPSKEITNEWEMQYDCAFAIINAIPAVISTIEKSIIAIKMQLATTKKTLDSAINVQETGMKRVKELEEACALEKAHAKEAEEACALADARIKQAELRTDEVENKLEKIGLNKPRRNNSCSSIKDNLHIKNDTQDCDKPCTSNQEKHCLINTPEIKPAKSERLRPVAGPRQCYCHRCGKGPYTRVARTCDHCSHPLKFPVIACLPMPTEARAIYLKRAQGWLTRHQLLREAKSNLHREVQSITEGDSSLAKSSARLSPPPYVKLERALIVPSIVSPGPIKITGRLAPLTMGL